MTDKEKQALLHKLADDVLVYVRLHPRSTTKDIFLAMIEKNGYYSTLIYSLVLEPCVDVSELDRAEKAKSKSEASAIIKKAVLRPVTKRRMNRGVMARIKRILAAQGHVIYGSSMFGQILKKDMNYQDAAMWLAPRISQISNESAQWTDCIDLLVKSGHFPKETGEIKTWASSICNSKQTLQATNNINLFFTRP